MLLAMGGAGPLIAQVAPDPLAPLPELMVAPKPVLPPVVRPVPSFPPSGPTVVLQRPGPAVPALTRSSVTGAAMGFAGYKAMISARARAAGVSEGTISSIIPFLSLDMRVVRLDRGQPGGVMPTTTVPPFAPYRRDHVTPSLIARGQTVYATNWTRLWGLQTRTGVDAAMPVAIFGHETSYGVVTGGFDLLDSLATLAYDGRRRALFEGELIAALQLIDRGTPRSRLRGSWAGATGYPQFMPSAVLKLAVDGDGDGRVDIWSSQSDALASIANFFKNAGWKAGVSWGVAARVPATFDRAAVRNNVVAARCTRVFARHSRWLTMREWRALGVVPTGRTLPDDEPASLLEPDGPTAPAYLLTSNYRVILEYNCSNFYALSVGLLADAIAQR